MRRTLIYSFAFLLALSGLSGQTTPLLPHDDTLVYIECSIKPISSASIHRQEQDQQEQKNQLQQRTYGTRPHSSLIEGTSVNWSGYVAATNLHQPTPGSVNAVCGIWVAPTLSATPDNSYCAIWVGIDGYTNGTVEQIGTEHDWSNGKQTNYAWFEMYPNGSYEITGFPVKNNDLIGGGVSYAGNNTFVLSIYNYTQGVYSTVPTAYTQSATAQRSSAEWVVEAPATTQGILPLANFGLSALNYCLVNMNGIIGPISNSHWMHDNLIMASPNGITKAIPSALLSGDNRFFVNWIHE